ncbi:MAG: GNAT family N-acetyltransferase [Burkholderiaceae bacterium]
MSQRFPLRPFLPADTERLQDLFAQSIEELSAGTSMTMSSGSPGSRGPRTRRRSPAVLAANVTLLIEQGGEILGFASMKDSSRIDVLYVHPFAIRQGVATTLVDALERLALARGSRTLSVDASMLRPVALARRDGRGCRSGATRCRWTTSGSPTRLSEGARGTSRRVSQDT